MTIRGRLYRGWILAVDYGGIDLRHLPCPIMIGFFAVFSTERRQKHLTFISRWTDWHLFLYRPSRGTKDEIRILCKKQ